MRLAASAPFKKGESIEFTFDRVVTEAVTAGACPQLQAADVNGWQHPSSVTFNDTDTIADYFLRNQEAKPSGRWMGTDSERRVKWVVDPSRTGSERFRGVFDPELYGISTQLTVAGSFGAFHATSLGWGTPKAEEFLDRTGFVLGGGGVACLTQLRATSGALVDWVTPVALGAKLAVATHKYSMTTAQGRYTCSKAICDQIDFVRRWSKVVSRYNPGAGGAYKIDSAPPGRTLGQEKINWIGDRAIAKYDVGREPSGP